MGTSFGEQTVEIAAPPEACFNALVDYDTYPDWQRAVKSAEVLELGADGLGKIVELRVDVKFRVVTYRLDYQYERPHRIRWDFIEGDGVEHIEGGYTFEPSGKGTRATYRLGIDAGVPIPGLIARTLNGQVMKRAAEDLKREVERRSVARRR